MRDDILLVEDRPDLVRDKYSKAIKNKDLDSLQAYRKKRAMRRKTKDLPERMDAIEKKMDMLLSKLDKLLDD